MASSAPTDSAAASLQNEKHQATGFAEVAPPEGTDEHHRQEILDRFTAEDDRRIMRKVDWHFLPLLVLMTIIKQFDYTNAASVRVLQVGLPSNIMKELGLSANDYNWLQTLYSLGMLFFEVPSNLLLKKVTPRKWMTRIFLTWGIVVACQAAVQNRGGIYACRFLLGVLEAGFFPGVTTQMCSWYRSDEYGKPVGTYFMAQAFSGVLGSLLVYGISYMDGLGNLSAWRWVFLLEGLVTILFSAVIYLVLPDYPKSARSAKWLTPDEQEYLEARLSENAPRTDEKAFRLSEIIDVLKDPRIIFFTACQLILNIAGYGLSWQTPVIVTQLGFTKLPRNQLLLIPPAMGQVLGQIAVVWFLSKAYVVRPAINMALCVGTLVFYIVLCFPVSAGATYAACVMGQSLFYTYFVVFWSWRSSSLVGATGTAFTLAAQTALAQVGSIIAPNVFQSKWAHNGYKKSFYILAVCVACAVVTTGIAWYLTRKLEYEVWQVRKHRIAAEKKNKVWTGTDVHFFENRVFYPKPSRFRARREAR